MSVMDAARAAAARPTYKELRTENERLRAMLEWIETYDPQIVEDAKMRFVPQQTAIADEK